MTQRKTIKIKLEKRDETSGGGHSRDPLKVVNTTYIIRSLTNAVVLDRDCTGFDGEFRAGDSLTEYKQDD